MSRVYKKPDHIVRDSDDGLKLKIGKDNRIVLHLLTQVKNN